MSETETIEVKEAPKILDIVEDNVALLKSKIIGLENLVEELTEKLDDSNNRYAQAKEFMDNDAKAELIAYISPRYNMPKELLVLKTVDELKEIKKVIDKVELPAFKAGTPLSYANKTSPRSKLDSMYAENMAKLKGGNK